MGPADSFSEKEMMGLGFLGSSASSAASSNLSPLAPPFTVDRYNHNNPNLNSNPIAHFDDPSHGVPFSSSWLYSHPSTARQDFLADSIRTATVPCANDDGYTSPEPISSTTTHNWFGENSNVKPGLGTHWSAVSAVNTSPRPATHVLSYDVSEAKPFYPSYAWPVSNSDIPSVALNNPSYVLPTTSDIVVNCEPSQVDYAQSLSVLEHDSPWENIWSELPGGKYGKRMEYDVSFLSEEANIASGRYINQGVYGTDTLSKRKEDSVMFPGNHADVFRRENYIGPPISGVSDSISSTAKDHCLVPKEFSEASAFKAFPMISESHPLVPSPASAKHWNIQKSYRLPEKRWHMFDGSDHCISPSIKKPSHSLVIKPPGPVTSFHMRQNSSEDRTLDLNIAGLYQPVTNFSAQDTDPIKSVEISDSAAFDSSKVVGSTHKYPLKEELRPSLGFDDKGSFLVPNQPGFQIGRTDDTFVVPSSTREEMSNKLSTNDQLYFEFKAGSNFQAPDTFKSSVMSAATSEHSEHHNPAEDSPCWKGSPTYHFSPFKSPEAEHPTKKLQTSNGINLQGSHSFYHSSKPTSAELCENSNSSERTSARTPTGKEHKPGGVVDVIGSAKASCRGSQSSPELTKPRKGYGFSNESTNDLHSENSQLKLPNLAEDVLLSDTKTQLPVGVKDHRSHAARNSSLSYVEDNVNLATAGEMNVNMLVKALHNISELLLFHRLDDGCSLKEQDHKALDHVTANLDVCMSRKLQQVVPTKKVMLPQHGSPNMFQEVTNGITGASHDHCRQHAYYRQRNHDIFGRSNDTLQGCASPREDVDLPKDQNMIQAIKKILDENLKCKEEMPSQTLLYKNLWLEAEAELCVVNYRARFECMKKEMKSCKLDEGTVSDVSEITCAMKKTSSSEPSPDLKISPMLIPEANDSTILNTHVQNPPSLSVDSHIDDVEASVMARYNMLKWRGESNNVERQEIASMGSQTSRANVQPYPQHHLDDAMHSLGDQMMCALSTNNVEPSIMALVNVLKRRGEPNAVGFEEQELADAANVEAIGDAVATQSNGTSLMQQFDSESGWEHIFEDEISWQTKGHIS